MRWPLVVFMPCNSRMALPNIARRRLLYLCQPATGRFSTLIVSLAIASLLGTPAAHSLRTAHGRALRRTDVDPGLEVSLRNILEYLLVQRQLRHQPFQLAVLLLQLFQSLRLVHLQTAVFLLKGFDKIKDEGGKKPKQKKKKPSSS